MNKIVVAFKSGMGNVKEYEGWNVRFNAKADQLTFLTRGGMRVFRLSGIDYVQVDGDLRFPREINF